MRPRAEPVDPTDTAALSAWLDGMSKLLAGLHDAAVDAVAPKGRRVHSRGHLRGVFRKGFRAVSLQLAAVKPTARGSLTTREQAERLAGALVVDLRLYHEEDIAHAAAGEPPSATLTTAIASARSIYEERVAAELEGRDSIFENAIGTVLPPAGAA